VILSLFFAVKFLSEFRSYRMMGSSEYNFITVSGHGEVTAVPDIASVSFTISKEAKTLKEAQSKMADTEKKALDFLKTSRIEDKDIRTSNISSYPKYDYVRNTCPQTGTEVMMYDCGGKQVLVGYVASENITVKIRNADEVGTIVQGLGGAGVSNLNGPNFEVDDEDALKVQARKKAIEDARAQAEVLAKDLGVRLVRISSFNEGGNYYPMYYGKDMEMSASSAPASLPAVVPKGENTISSDVTITYQIR
jgi:uncharacterized protein YggE